MNKPFILIQPELHIYFCNHHYKTLSIPSNMTIYDIPCFNSKKYGSLKKIRIMPSANCIWLIAYNSVQNFDFMCIGSQSQPIFIDMSGYTNYIAVIFDVDTVYFNPKVAPLRPSTLRNQLIHFKSEIQSPEYQLISELTCTNSFDDHIEVLLNYINQYKQHCNFPSAFQNMYNILLNANETISLQEISDKTRYSVRHINRMFNDYLGYGPKTLCKYIRFQKVLREIISNPKRQNSEFILNIEYSDQAHFQREFKSFMGETPKCFCNRMAAFYNKYSEKM